MSTLEEFIRQQPSRLVRTALRAICGALQPEEPHDVLFVARNIDLLIDRLRAQGNVLDSSLSTYRSRALRAIVDQGRQTSGSTPVKTDGPIVPPPAAARGSAGGYPYHGSPLVEHLAEVARVRQLTAGLSWQDAAMEQALNQREMQLLTDRLRELQEAMSK